MTYNKAEVKAVGNAVYDLLEGLSDGIGNQEIANLMKVLTAAVAASDEFKSDFDAAGPHVLAQMADRFGDRRVNPTP